MNIEGPTEEDAAWLAHQMNDDNDPEPVDLDDHGDADTDPDTDDVEQTDDAEPTGKVTAHTTGRFTAKTKLIGLAAAAGVAVLAASALFYAGGGDTHHATPQEVADPVAKPAPTNVTPAVSPQTDRPLPYTADASGSCPAGSTSAQTMDGADPRNAFVCVRGGLDGQVITLELPKTYVVTAIVLTPGWVGKDASGAEQWAQHRVISTVQYTFNDSGGTLITQQTGNVHGEATIPVKRVMASRITMLIRQTARPPAQPSSTAPQPGGLDGPGLEGILGDAAPTAGPLPQVPLFDRPITDSDPADATFAISRLTVIGHEAI